MKTAIERIYKTPPETYLVTFYTDGNPDCGHFCAWQTCGDYGQTLSGDCQRAEIFKRWPGVTVLDISKVQWIKISDMEDKIKKQEKIDYLLRNGAAEITDKTEKAE